MITPYKKQPAERFTIIVVENHNLQNYSKEYNLAINVMDHVINTFGGSYKYVEYLRDEDITSCTTEFALVVKIGTRFNFRVLLDNFDYETVSLVGHILDKGSRYWAVHDQCFIVKVADYDVTRTKTLRSVERSEENFHDDYTPIWIKDGGKEIYIHGCDLHGEELPSGAYLISNLLRAGKKIEPFNRTVRDDKRFLYIDWKKHKGYYRVHPQKLDIFQKKNQRVFAWSTETQYDRDEIKIEPYEHFVGCANGLQALLYTHTKLKSITFCDINENSLRFTKELISNWSPQETSYGEFCDEQEHYANFQKYSVVGDIKIPLVRMTHEYLNNYFIRIIDQNPELLDVIELINNKKIECNYKLVNMLDPSAMIALVEDKKCILYFSNASNYSITAHNYSVLETDIILKKIKIAANKCSVFIGNCPEHEFAPIKSDVKFSFLDDYSIQPVENLNFPWRRKEYEDYKRRIRKI